MNGKWCARVCTKSWRQVAPRGRETPSRIPHEEGREGVFHLPLISRPVLPSWKGSGLPPLSVILKNPKIKGDEERRRKGGGETERNESSENKRTRCEEVRRGANRERGRSMERKRMERKRRRVKRKYFFIRVMTCWSEFTPQLLMVLCTCLQHEEHWH